MDEPLTLTLALALTLTALPRPDTRPRYSCETPAVGFHLADPAADGIVDTSIKCVAQSSAACSAHLTFCTTGPDVTKLACNKPMPKYYVDRHGHAKGASCVFASIFAAGNRQCQKLSCSTK